MIRIYYEIINNLEKNKHVCKLKGLHRFRLLNLQVDANMNISMYVYVCL